MVRPSVDVLFDLGQYGILIAVRDDRVAQSL